MSQKLLAKHHAILSAIPLFEGLDSPELMKVAGLATIRLVAAREVVVAQGEPASALFAIARGRLKVVSCGPDGRDAALGIMGEGEVFGEVALIDGGARSATCTALEPCDLIVLERLQFLKLLDESPTISVKLLHVLAQRLRRLSQRSEDAAFLDVPSRLARSLLDLATRFGQSNRTSGIFITLKLSQQELGDLVGATRESVNKHLSDWTRQGVVRLEDGRMLIADVDGLRRLARVVDD